MIALFFYFFTFILLFSIAVLFGGRTYYYVESDENDDVADVAAKLPSSAADGYGKPFFDVFKDFYKT